MSNSVQQSDILQPVWRDFSGVAHACQAVDVHNAFLLMSTLCNRAVPPNARYVPHAHAQVTCKTCTSKSA